MLGYRANVGKDEREGRIQRNALHGDRPAEGLGKMVSDPSRQKKRQGRVAGNEQNDEPEEKTSSLESPMNA